MLKLNKLVFLAVFALLFSISSFAQSSDVHLIEETILGFSKSGDSNNDKELATYLDDSYRIVMNRLFGSQEVSIMSKSVFLDKIRTKEFGGDQRDVVIESIQLNDNSASAIVSFIGTKMTFRSILILIKDEESKWKLVSEIPVLK